jgi:hypothetical protein
MAIVFPIRFRTADPARRQTIIDALRAHGVQISAGPADDVCEACVQVQDPVGETYRALVAALDRDVPGWQQDATLYGAV